MSEVSHTSKPSSSGKYLSDCFNPAEYSCAVDPETVLKALSLEKSSFAKTRLMACRFEGSLTSMSNLAFFNGTPLLASQFNNNISSIISSKFNLAHISGKKINQNYLELIRSHFGLEGIDLSISALTGSGTAANIGVVEALHHYFEKINGDRIGLICSRAAHISFKRIPRIPLYQVGTDNEGTLSTDKIKEIISNSKPVCIVLTGPRTEDGVIEGLDQELSEIIRREGIFIVRDAILGGIVPYFNDIPFDAADKKPFFKEKFKKAISPGSYDFLTCGVSKHIGMPNNAAIICSNNLPDRLKEVLCEEFNLNSDLKGENYFDGGGTYGTTTLESSSAILTIRMFNAVELRTQRLLAINAMSAAEKLAGKLRDLGIETGPVNINFVPVFLKDMAEVKRVKEILRNSLIEVAECNNMRTGIKLILPLDQVIEEYTFDYLAQTVFEAINGGNPPKDAPKFKGTLPEYYEISPAYYAEFNKFYTDEACKSEGHVYLIDSIKDSLSQKLPEHLFANYEQSQVALGILHMLTGCRSDIFSRALESAFLSIISIDKASDVKGLMKHFGDDIAKNIYSNEAAVWNEKLKLYAIQLKQAARWMERSAGIESRALLLSRVCESIAIAARAEVEDWVKQRKFIPRLDLDISLVAEILDTEC